MIKKCRTLCSTREAGHLLILNVTASLCYLREFYDFSLIASILNGI